MKVMDIFRDIDLDVDIDFGELLPRVEEPEEGMMSVFPKKRRAYYTISGGNRSLAKILSKQLPTPEECIKLISFRGGFASINFINYVARREPILELTASTLRIGEKQFRMRTKDNYYVLETSSNLNENPKIEQYSFENDEELYAYYYRFFKRLREISR